MNIEFLDAPVSEVRAKIHEYRQRLKTQHTKEDKAILTAYRQVLRGERVLDIHQAFANAGCDEDGRPHLAIVRADLTWCHCVRSLAGTHLYGSDKQVVTPWQATGSRVAKSRRLILPPQTLPVFNSEGGWFKRCRAPAPSIPPNVRAKMTTKPENYHVLWEADWEDVPYDPLLLKRIGTSNLFQVLAQWDLTELERAVLFDVRFVKHA